jgi:hypothetical protein
MISFDISSSVAAAGATRRVRRTRRRVGAGAIMARTLVFNPVWNRELKYEGDAAVNGF